MIKIAVIDDEKEVQDMIKQEIENVGGLTEQIEVVLYDEAESILLDLKEKKEYDIVFSDIRMINMQGIELGKIIRTNFPNIRLVFLTAYMEYAVESYLIDAYQYILKEQIKERMPKILKQIVKEICEERQSYQVLKKNGEIHKILHKDIIYIKKMKNAKYIQYITKKEEFVERKTLKQVLLDIDDSRFMLLERGYIVNIIHVLKLSNNRVYMDNGEEVPVSRNNYQEVKKVICALWEKNNV